MNAICKIPLDTEIAIVLSEELEIEITTDMVESARGKEEGINQIVKNNNSKIEKSQI